MLLTGVDGFFYSTFSKVDHLNECTVQLTQPREHLDSVIQT